MAEAFPVPVRITRVSTDFPLSAVRYFYTVEVPDGRPYLGNAELMVFPVSAKRDDDYFRDVFAFSFNELIGSGLHPTSIIAFLRKFYPNGEGTEESLEGFTRKGVGSGVLEHLVSDALQLGAVGMYVRTYSTSMKTFLAERHGFVPFDAKVPAQYANRWHRAL